MRKYRLESKGGEVDMILSYGEDGFLVSWQVVKECPPTFWRLLWKLPPLNIIALGKMEEVFPGMFRLADVPADLSFKAFWDAYAHKVGNKGKVEKLWERLGEADRVAALAGIPRYDSFLATKPSMERAFPETWVRNRRWEV